MNFLALLAERILERILGAFVDWARKKFQARKERKAVEDEAKRAAQKLKDAQTGEEVDAAADDQLNHF